MRVDDEKVARILRTLNCTPLEHDALLDLRDLRAAAREMLKEWDGIEYIIDGFADQWAPFMERIRAQLAQARGEEGR